MMYILAAILIFGVLVAVHEGGHFLAARLCGVTVHEFAIGMGPILWKKEPEEGTEGTRYSLRLLPIGGFCATGPIRGFLSRFLSLPPGRL